MRKYIKVSALISLQHIGKSILRKFKQSLCLGITLLLMFPGVLSAEHRRDLPFLLTELQTAWTLPVATEQQSKQLTEALAGFWLSSIPVAETRLFSTKAGSTRAAAKKKILAFSTKNSALIQEQGQGKLASYKVKGYRATSLSFVAECLLIRKAQLLEKQNDPNVTEFYKKRRVYPLQKMIDRFIVITKEAQAAGYEQAEEMVLSFETRKSFFEVDRQILRLLLIGGGLYLADGISYLPFDRQAVLWNELAKEKPAIWAEFDVPLISAWREINVLCSQMVRGNQPAEACWVFRNRAAELGAALTPAPVKSAPKQVPKRSAAELHLIKYMASSTFVSGSEQLPLDYCIDFKEKQSGKLFYRQLKARGYRNTLWSLNLYIEAIDRKPVNWSEQEYSDMRRSYSLRARIFLRENGVLGLAEAADGGMIFDARNKWALNEGRLSISLDNDQVKMSFNIVKSSGLKFSSNIQPAPMHSSLTLVHGNYAIYPSEVPFKHRQAKLLREAQKLQSCNGNIYVAGVTPESLPALPEVTWPTRKKDSFPRHWYIRSVPIYYEYTGKKLTPMEIDLGGFFYLRESGDIGRNIEDPADYDFTVEGRWSVDGSSMQWKIGGIEINFESNQGFTDGIVSELITDSRRRYLIIPTDLLAGVVVKQAQKTVKQSIPAPIPTPEPVSVPAKKKVAVPVPIKVEPVADIAPILGCWHWSNGGRILFQADGSVINGPIRTTWKKSNAALQYSVVWPPIEDKIKLSKDQSAYSGTGIFNIPLSGTRQGSGQGLPGRWLRNDGQVLDIAADGSVSAGPLRGSWRSEAENGFTVSWPVIDMLIVSADGKSLQVSNQFGKVTARKQGSITGCR